jgi:hypothetical protein
MKHSISAAIAGLIVTGGLVLAQAPVQAPPPASPASAQNQMTMQMLGEMLRTATTFHDLVRSMNLNQSLGPDPHSIGPDGKLHHSMDRTAETIGAGAGVGAAIGAMSHNQNGVMIGALIGGAGGLIIDQVVKQHEQQQARAVAAPVTDPRSTQPSRGFKTRDDDFDRRAN